MTSWSCSVSYLRGTVGSTLRLQPGFDTPGYHNRSLAPETQRRALLKKTNSGCRWREWSTLRFVSAAKRVEGLCGSYQTQVTSTTCPHDAFASVSHTAVKWERYSLIPNHDYKRLLLVFLSGRRGTSFNALLPPTGMPTSLQFMPSVYILRFKFVVLRECKTSLSLSVLYIPSPSSVFMEKVSEPPCIRFIKYLTLQPLFHLPLHHHYIKQDRADNTTLWGSIIYTYHVRQAVPHSYLYGTGSQEIFNPVKHPSLNTSFIQFITNPSFHSIS